MNIDIKEYRRKYYQEHKDRMREQTKKYQSSINGKLSMNKSSLLYAKTDAGKLSQIKYRKTDLNKISRKKSQAKRKQNLEFNPINNIFEKSHFHHLDKRNGIFIPKDLHKSIWHSLKKSETMLKINIKAWDFLESQSY